MIKNKPLTLEQLREMDGKPVWIENIKEPSKSEWKLCHQGHGDYLIFQGGYLQGFKLEEYGKNWLKEYGKTWFAYAYPPAHIDREVWKPCKACTGCASCRHSLASGSDSKSACFWCDNHNRYKPRSFCPECGRPLTEEAWEELEKRVI